MNWKPIKDFPDYLISDCGKVKRMHRRILKKDGVIANYKEMMLKPTKDTHGYYFIRLGAGSGKRGLWIHRLVAEAFIGFTEERKYVNHIDGNKTNNHVSNLEICTSGENQKHAYRTGLRGSSGAERNGNYKGTITATNIETGEKFYFNSRKELAEFGFPPASVYACCLGKQKQSRGYTFSRGGNVQ